MKININLPALHTNRMYNRNVESMSTTLEKLSSGKRINHAADDAAGLAISEKMHRTLRGLQQASRNTMDDISFVKTFEGALDEVHSMLQRMKELAVQGANDSYLSEDRKTIDAEISQLTKQIDDIANNTHFNGIHLLKGEKLNYTDKDGKHATSNTLYFQIGGEEKQDIPLEISNYKVNTKDSLGISSRDAAGNTHSIVDFEDGGSNQSLIQPLKEAYETEKINVQTTTTTLQVAKEDYDNQVKEVNDKYQALNEAKENLKANPTNPALQAAVTAAQNAYNTAQANLTTAEANWNGAQTLHNNTMQAMGEAQRKYESGIRELYQKAITTYGDAIGKISSLRSNLGAIQNRLESTERNLGVSIENVMDARSRIENIDMAQEYSEYVRTNILHQASTSMLGHANQMPQAVLQLLNR